MYRLTPKRPTNRHWRPGWTRSMAHTTRGRAAAAFELPDGVHGPWPVVKSGSNGHPIKTLQYLLRARGQSVAVDGVFGPNTAAAVKAFQTSHGLTADGIVGLVTWAALVVQVKKGSQGDEVRGVQE